MAQEPSLVQQLTDDEVLELFYDWKLWARDNQFPPAIDPDNPWVTWLILAGRGFGKTWVGANWVNDEVYHRRMHRIALIAEDAQDARDVSVEGESGIIATAAPWNKPHYEPSKRRLTWPNGAVATIYTDSDPEALRGPQHDGFWVDELGKFKHAKAVWSNLMFGLRMGSHPHGIVTTTPRPLPHIVELMKSPTTVTVRGSTYENRANLSPVFYAEVIKEYEGTTLGRQELLGEMINPEEAGVIRRSWLRRYPAFEKSKETGKQVAKPLPKLLFIVQSYDTAFTEKTFDKDTREPDFSACTVWGVFDGAKGQSILMLDAWKEQISYPNLRRHAFSAYTKDLYGPKGKERRADLIIIEDKGSGITLRQDLAEMGLPVHAYNPGRADKMQRLHASSHLVEHGLVYIPESEGKPGEFKTWAVPFVDQVCSFPMNIDEHDDYVDTFSQVMLILKDMGHLKVQLPEKVEDLRKDLADDKYRGHKPAQNPYG